MKKITLFLTALFVTLSVFAQTAAVECTKISEIAALENGAAFKYTGAATATFHVNYGGIIVEDATGAIQLNGSIFLFNNAEQKIKTGMTVKSFEGTVSKSETALLKATFTTEQMAAVTFDAQINDLAPLEVTAADLLADPAKYYGKALTITATLNAKKQLTGAEGVNPVSFSAAYYNNKAEKINIVPSAGTYVGYVSPAWNGPKFNLYDRSRQIPTAFNHFKEIKQYFANVTDELWDEYEILDSAMVTNVYSVGGASVIYLYQKAGYIDIAIAYMTSSEADAKLAVGQYVKGIKGYLTQSVYDNDAHEVISGSLFNGTEGVDLVKCSTVGEVAAVAEKNLSALRTSYFVDYEYNLYNYPIGTLNKAADESLMFYTNDDYGLDSIAVGIFDGAAGWEEAYLGKKVALTGFFDAGGSFCAVPTIMLRNVNDIHGTSEAFDNIAAMKAAGTPSIEGYEYILNNELLVNAVLNNVYDPNYGEKASYLYLQDETGAFCIKAYATFNVAAGDKISGAACSYDGYTYLATSDQVANLVVKSSGNAVEPVEATIAQLVAEDNAAFTDRYVKLSGVTVVEQNFGTEEDPLFYRFFKQGDAQILIYFPWNSKFPKDGNLDVIGVFDSGSMYEGGASFHPMDVTKAVVPEVKPGVTALWEIKVADMEYKDIRNGFDYLNGELLFASRRNKDTEVVVYDAATGLPKMNGDVVEQLKSHADLNMAWAGGDVAVDENGAIYVAASNNANVYRYADKTAEPVVFVTLPKTGFWAFDVKVDAEGNGCLMAAPQNGNEIYYVPVTANVAGAVKTIDFGANLGGVPHFDIVSNNSFWVDGGNIAPTFVTLNADLSAVASSKAVVSEVINNSANGVKQFAYNGKNYLVAAANNHDATFTKAPNHSVALFELSDTLGLTQVGTALPAAGFGLPKDNNANYDEPVVVVKEDAAYIYVMAGSAGIGAYKFVAPAAPSIVTVTTPEELKANAGKEVLYNNLVLYKEGSSFFDMEYYIPDSVTTVLNTDNNFTDGVIPAKMDCKGIYDAEAGTFTISEVVNPYAFFDFDGIKAFFESASEEQKAAQYEIIDPVLVAFVNMNGSSAYAQYGNDGFCISLNFGYDPLADVKNVGDKFTNIKGIYTPAEFDENGKLLNAASFEVSEFVKQSTGAEIAYAKEDLASMIEQIEYYVPGLYSLPSSTKFGSDDMAYYIKYEGFDEQYNTVIDSLEVTPLCSFDIDSNLENPEGLVPHVIFDVLDGAPVVYLVDMVDTKIYYNSIAEMIEAGTQAEYTSISTLMNPVVVNYISSEDWGYGPMYTMFIQDNTAAIRIDLGSVENLNIQVGDSITGIAGFVDLAEGSGAPRIWSGSDYGVDVNLTKVADGKITAIPATIKDLLAEEKASMDESAPALKFANKVIKLENVKKVDDPLDEKWPYIVQGNDSLKISSYYWSLVGAVPFDSMTIVGIADYSAINGAYYSIQPLNKESVTNLAAPAPADGKIVYPFKDIADFAEWPSSYSEHVVEYPEATVTFAKANKQSGTITDIPVTKGSPVTVAIKNNKAVKYVKLIARQWDAKTQTITLTAGGKSYTSDNFVLEVPELPVNSDTLKFTFSSTKNQIGIDSLIIELTDKVAVAVELPVLSANSGNVLDAFDLTISCPTEGAEIHYALNGGAAAKYEKAIRIAETTTVAAWSVKGDAVSDTVTATYNFPVAVANLAEFYAKGKEAKELNFKINSELVVTYVGGNNVFLKDTTAAANIFDFKFAENAALKDLKSGDKLTGIVSAYGEYNGVPQLNPAYIPAAVAGEAVAAEVVDIKYVNAEHFNEYVKIENVELIDSVAFVADKAFNASVVAATDTLAIRSQFKNIEGTFAKGAVVTIEGIVSQFSNAPQLNITSIVLADNQTGVENVESNAVVYANNATVYVEAEEGSIVEVYTIQGQRVFAAEATSETTVISGIEANFVIVRVNNEIHKVIMK